MRFIEGIVVCKGQFCMDFGSKLFIYNTTHRSMPTFSISLVAFASQVSQSPLSESKSILSSFIGTEEPVH